MSIKNINNLLQIYNLDNIKNNYLIKKPILNTIESIINIFVKSKEQDNLQLTFIYIDDEQNQLIQLDKEQEKGITNKILRTWISKSELLDLVNFFKKAIGFKVEHEIDFMESNQNETFKYESFIIKKEFIPNFERLDI